MKRDEKGREIKKKKRGREIHIRRRKRHPKRERGNKSEQKCWKDQRISEKKGEKQEKK